MASDTEGVLPTPEAWRRVGEAVRIVEGNTNNKPLGDRQPYMYPAMPFKVTGDAVDGFYPAVIVAWDTATAAWIETEDCYVKQGELS